MLLWCNTLTHLSAAIVSILILLVQSLHGYFRKFSGESSMPLVSTCSAAISANCHRPEADKEAHLLPVQWGVSGEDDSGSKLCSFTTSRYVEAPTSRHEYLTYRRPSAESTDRKRPWVASILPKMKNIWKRVTGLTVIFRKLD